MGFSYSKEDQKLLVEGLSLLFDGIFVLQIKYKIKEGFTLINLHVIIFFNLQMKSYRHIRVQQTHSVRSLSNEHVSFV